MDLRRSTRLLRALVGACAAALVAASCGRDAPTAPAAPRMASDLLGPVTGATAGLVGKLLACSPLPYAADSAVIGYAGGVLHLGVHTLVIPPGALDHPVFIRGEAPSDSVNSVRLYPEGLRFERPAALTMSYANCGLVTWLLPRIAYTTDGLRILYFIPTLGNLFTKHVTGQVEHFSRYAVAW